MIKRAKKNSTAAAPGNPHAATQAGTEASDSAAGAASELTPMMRQYHDAKSKHPGEIVFFRMGDFYEMFFDDAEVAAGILGIALTSRSKDRSGVKIPMAGVPVKSLDAHVRKLLLAGKRVAICEQLEDANLAKGIVERGVVRVITPGTFVEENCLEESEAHHLAALLSLGDRAGLAWIDLSTGRFCAEDLAPNELEPAILRIRPVELLYTEGLRADEDPQLRWIEQTLTRTHLTGYPEWHFDHSVARERLLGHFGTTTLEAFGCENLTVGIQAAGALIHYLEATQKQTLPHILKLSRGRTRNSLKLDAATFRALDLLEVARTGDRQGSLLEHLDRTRTALGARLLREWIGTPLLDLDEILARQRALGDLSEDRDRLDQIRRELGQIRDIERLASRASLGRLNGRDLRSLERSLRPTPEIAKQLDDTGSHWLEEVRATLENPRLIELADEIDAAISLEPPISVKEGGLIRDHYDSDLDELRKLTRDGVDWIAKFQAREAERTGIPNLKVGYNRVFGYYLEVTHTHRERVPDDYIRKQTLKNAERYITPDLKEQESRVLSAEEQAQNLEYELFQALRQRVEEELPLLQETAEALAKLDAVGSLAELARVEEYVRPELTEEIVLEIEAGFHPVVGAGARRETFTPNDVVLAGGGPSLAVITGPNMAGKSTYIRQTALIVLLAQIGSYVPAARARIGLTDAIYTRVGAADDLARGQSTFMVEMTETAHILNNATDRSLVILDEVGRGTSTLDGVSLAWSIAEHLIRTNRSRTLFATHYHELIELEEHFPHQVQNLNVLVKEWQEEIVFLHQIVPGSTDKAYGIHVARLAGVPEAALRRARDILSALELKQNTGGGVPAERANASQQLNLFERDYEATLERLRSIHVEETTPLEALRILDELKRSLP